MARSAWGDLKRTSQSRVVLGPSLVLDAVLACCAAVTFGLIGRRWTAIRARILRPIALLGTLASCAYLLFVRLAEHSWIDVAVPPEAVWPWLAQMGQNRGGLYSYEWLQNLAGFDFRNAVKIIPDGRM